MADFAYYRLPEKKEEYHAVQGKAIAINYNAELGNYNGELQNYNGELQNYNAELRNYLGELSEQKGFLLASFNIGGEHPLLLIPAEKSEVKIIPDAGLPVSAHWQEKDYKEEYHKDFARFHHLLEDGTLDKIVLSRRLDMTADKDVDAKEIFFQACRMYPHQMIALVSTSQSGTWLMATPEILLKKDDDEWQTMALAGTMDKPGPWSDKNIREQYIVAAYVMNCVSRYSYLIRHSSPHAVTAAKLYHLCTDFSFRLSDDKDICKVLADLYPTPAVCGLPKDKAFDTIMKYESVDRKYYSGFSGPMNVDGETHLYVSLRCMEILNNECHLYAGGGLLKESDEETEWKETEVKLKTMKDLL